MRSRDAWSGHRELIRSIIHLGEGQPRERISLARTYALTMPLAKRPRERAISDLTRRDITDYLVVEQINWAGRYDEPAFLKRIFPELDSMPSTDHRFTGASADIWQHRVNNPQDWEDDWIFEDPRFDLRAGPDELFVKFLAEMVHPLVGRNAEETKQLVAFFNERLRHDGWEIAEVSQMSGRPVFEGRRIEALRTPTESLNLDGYERLENPDVLQDHLRRIERDLGSDPPGAIGFAKELVESICKLILDDYAVPWNHGDDMMDLYKKVQAVLKLNTEAVPDSAPGSKAAVRVLRAQVTTVQAMAEMRNAMGLGHGRTTRSPALTRHARLAFNSALALSEFLIETWHVRRSAL